jgi:hypothetical protein
MKEITLNGIGEYINIFQFIILFVSLQYLLYSMLQSTSFGTIQQTFSSIHHEN